MLSMLWYRSSVQCGGGVLFGVIVLMGRVVVGLWVCCCVWGFPTGRLICLGLGFVEAFIAWGCTPTKICWGRCLEDGGFWDSGFFLVPLLCGCGFSCGGLRAGLVSADLLLCLFVGVMVSWAFYWWGSSIVLF